MNNQIASRVRRAHLLQVNGAVTEFELEPTGERPCRLWDGDPLELKASKGFLDVFGSNRVQVGMEKSDQCRRRYGAHLASGSFGGDDLCTFEEPVAVAVVTVGVGVHHRIDWAGSRDGLHRVEHLTSKDLVKQGVNEQRGVPRGKQSSV